ncbi:MAG: hypothetical protein JXR40_03905 [Pontiellaceae bacterium]|nr:hypothetical protein [Pontiellaceae bacterium]
MNLTNQELQEIVAATVAVMQAQSGRSEDMPISNQQQSRELTIPAHGEKTIPFIGSYVAVLSNTGAGDVLVSMDNGISNFIKAGTGYPCVRLSQDKTTYEPAVYKRVVFENRTDYPMTIEYILSLGPVTDTRAVIQGWLQVDLASPSMQTPSALSVGPDEFVVLPLNALVKERLIQNNGSYPVWWGADDAIGPDTKRGLCLYPGSNATINCSGAIYFKAQDGVTFVSINQMMKG